MARKILLLLLIVTVVVVSGCSSEGLIKERIEKANYCKEDSDCTITSFGCPFGCWSPVNKAEVEKLQKLVDNYNKKGIKCIYDCDVAPKGSEVRCINNKCQIKQLECNSDADCSIAGCSGEVCTTKEKAKEIFTICEYKPEYDCYKLTSCSCVNGKCSWVMNNEFSKCLQQKGG